jgi:hypothetical protein
MSDKSKFYYLFTNEDLSIINIFGKYIIECLEEYLLFQSMGANKLHTLIIVIGGNYTYIYKIYINTMFLVGFRALKKKIII